MGSVQLSKHSQDYLRNTSQNMQVLIFKKYLIQYYFKEFIFFCGKREMGPAIVPVAAAVGAAVSVGNVIVSATEVSSAVDIALFAKDVYDAGKSVAHFVDTVSKPSFPELKGTSGYTINARTVQLRVSKIDHDYNGSTGTLRLQLCKNYWFYGKCKNYG